MSSAVLETPSSKTIQMQELPMVRSRTLERLAFAAIAALAAILRFANLEVLGNVNHYYTAAIKAMLTSWHNFFFVAAEPGGSVSVDKPPVGLWIQALSARLLGVNTLGVLLPEILAGILSVIVVYYLVRRSFGTVAGLIAGLALAITPVVVATDRNNTMDSTLILTLLLATCAFIKATEQGKLRYLLLGALLVGIGFNIKMLQAYLPLPAFCALYFLGSSERLWRKMVNLALATALLLVVSLSWATIVDLTPADQRPYVGSSSNNSVMDLILGYNGMQRLVGMGRNGNLQSVLSGLFNLNQLGGRQGQFPNGGFQPPQGGPGGFGAARGGFPGTAQPGALRLFTTPLSKEMSWLLPFGLFAAVLLVFRGRPHWPIAPKHQALVLWGGWLITAGIFFSVAGFFHEYYLSMLAPPLAALVGIGVIELWSVYEKHPWLAMAWLLLATIATLWLQFNTAKAFVNSVWWFPLPVGLVLIGVIMLIPLVHKELNYAPPAGFACMIGALLLTPAIWSGLTTLNSSSNQSLPAAYDGRSSGPANLGRTQVDQTLLAYLQARTQNTKFLMAVPSSMQGADYVLATGQPVLYLGGFMGQDRVITSEGLAELVANGDLRFVYWDTQGGNGFGGGRGGPQSDISAWVTSHCTSVNGFDVATQNAGAPDGTGGAFGNAVFRGRGGMQVSLYDCGS